MVNAHQLKVQRTAHYYTFGQASEQTKYFWIVTHGYGQLASQIIHKFDDFDEQQHFVLAPEGLNKFYWKRPQVGAAWMTSQHRLQEIEDYTAFIQTLYQQYCAQLSDDVQIILFGFSQGCQTQVRWALRALPHFHHLVLWAGLLPDDLDFIKYRKYLKDKHIYFVYGDEDEYLTDDIFQWQLGFIHEQQLQVSFHTFEGKHRIERAMLQRLWEECICLV